MDEWGFESGEELKVLEKKSGKRSSLPRFALPALLIAAGLLVVLAPSVERSACPGNNSLPEPDCPGRPDLFLYH